MMTTNEEKICAIVVTYKRPELLKKCLNGVLSQRRLLDKIFVVDNDSRDGTEEMMKREFNFSQIEYINITGENIGPAACWGVAMKKALKECYDWLWLMDDDVEPFEDALVNLLDFAQYNKCCMLQCRWEFADGSPYLWVPPLDINRIRSFNVEREYLNRQPFFLTNVTCFEGLLVNRKVVQEFGYPIADMFICWDDTEYGLRCSKKYQIYSVLTAKMRKNLDSRTRLEKKVFLCFKKDRYRLSDFWINYYYVRNLFMVLKLHSTSKWVFVWFFLIYFKMILDVTMYDDSRMLRWSILLRACIDGIRGKYGKSIYIEKLRSLGWRATP